MNDKILEAAKALVAMIENQKEEGNKVRLADLNPGDVFNTAFGDMMVLEQMPDCTKVITKGTIGEKREFDDESPDYNESTIKEYVETEIIPVFEKEFGPENLLENTVLLTTVDMRTDYGTYTGKARLLTFDESRKYNYLLANEEISGYYWTLTPWSVKGCGSKYSVTVVSPRGDFNYFGCYNDCCVRPVCILKSNIFVSKDVKVSV